MTNEELAELKDYGALYEKNIRLIRHIATAYDNERVPLEDLTQEAFFAVVKAVRAYNEKREYKFTTYLTKALKWHFSRYLKRDKNMRDMLILNDFVDGEEETERVDLIADDEQDVEGKAIKSVYSAEIIEAVDEALNSPRITERDRYIFRQRYYHGRTGVDIAKELNLSHQLIHQTLRNTMRELRKPHNKLLRYLYDDVISRHAYNGSLSAFNYLQASSVELAVMKLEEKNLLKV